MSKQIFVGSVAVGGGAPITVQSMCNVPFSRLDELKKQAVALEQAGCDILRVAVPDMQSAKLIPELKKEIGIPLVADIHFDYRLALASMDAGIDKIRINPGNIASDNIRDVAKAAKSRHIPIRVGINGGSLEKDLVAKYGHPCAEALAESAARNVKLLEDCDFHDIAVSMKSSDVATCVAAYKIFDEKYNKNNYPLHIGITETGTVYRGLLKSAAGIGALLLDGIGDTIRVSLTADPVEEVRAGIALLKALRIRNSGIEIISCPTCGRTTVDSVVLANRIESEFSYVKQPIKIAVMGCVVNGVGEAAECDFGVTGANGKYILFKSGTVIKKDISEDSVFSEIENGIKEITDRQ